MLKAVPVESCSTPTENSLKPSHSHRSLVTISDYSQFLPKRNLQLAAGRAVPEKTLSATNEVMNILRNPNSMPDPGKDGYPVVDSPNFHRQLRRFEQEICCAMFLLGKLTCTTEAVQTNEESASSRIKEII